MLVTAPIYSQLSELMRGLIQRGEFREGERFLTERQVSERFGVSRATANKALSNLVAEGTVEFRKGVGTFVRGGLLGYDLRSLVSFTEKARAAGKAPTTHVLAFREAGAEETESEVWKTLQLSLNDRVFFMERLRLADGLPVILERRHLAARFCPGLTAEVVGGSLYELMSGKHCLEISGADEIIRAVGLNAGDAALLQVTAETACLRVTSVGYLSGGVPLWHEHTLYRGDAYEFHNRLGPIQTARPAAGAFVDIGK